MKPADKVLIGSWIWKGGKLVFKKKADEVMFKALSEGLREGSSVAFIIDFVRDDGTLAQIAKLKAGIKDLGREAGISFKNAEEQVKANAGLFDELRDEFKSFGVCSKQELSDAIQAMIELGEFCNLDLK